MPSRRPLRGWKEIAQHLGTSERTAQRWEREQGLPVHRVGNTPGATVFASAHELDAWRSSPRGQMAGSSPPDEEIASATENAGAATNDFPTARRPSRHGLAIVAAIVVLIAAAVVVAEVVYRSPSAFKSSESVGGRRGPALAVLILKVTDASGRAFTCRVLDGGQLSLSQRQKARLALTPRLAPGSATVEVAAVAVESARTERPATSSTHVQLHHAAPEAITLADWHLRVEWIGVEAAGRTAAAGGSPSDTCAVECGTTFVQALQVVADCGSCCALTFTGCNKGLRPN